MVRELMHDPLFLGKKSEDATAADVSVARDLLDTLAAHRETCVGMAANMIGVTKRIIAFNDQGKLEIMFNPEIIKASGEYETEEGCLSLVGVRKTKRYENIEVEYFDINWKKQKGKFSGWTAQIIQHECDHLEGIII